MVYDVEEATLSPYLRSVSNAWKEEAATITILRVSREGGSVGGVNSPQDRQSGDSTSASSSALVEDTKSLEGATTRAGSVKKAATKSEPVVTAPAARPTDVLVSVEADSKAIGLISLAHGTRMLPLLTQPTAQGMWLSILRWAKELDRQKLPVLERDFSTLSMGDTESVST